MRKMMKWNKKIVAASLASVMVLSMASGCGPKTPATPGNPNTTESKADIKYDEVAVLHVGDEDVTLNVAYLYAMLCIYANYKNGLNINDMPSYKSQVLEQLRKDYVEYYIATTTEGIEWTNDDEKELEKVMAEYKAQFPKEMLDYYGITDETLKDVFTRQTYIAKLKNKALNDLYNDKMEEIQKEYGDKTFHDMDYALFPLYEYKEDGSVVTDDNGNPVAVSESKKKEQKEKAEEFAKRAQAGEKLDDLIKEYGIEAYSGNQSGYEGMYEDSLDELVASLKTGDISDVVETQAGYMIVEMLNDNAEEYKEYFLDYYAGSEAENDYGVMESYWLSASGVNDDSVESTIWDAFDMSDVVATMQKYKAITLGN